MRLELMIFENDLGLQDSIELNEDYCALAERHLAGVCNYHLQVA